MTTTTVILARHGRTRWHSRNCYTGSTDIGIDETGRQEALALADWARDVKPYLLYASTMLRARQTAALVAQALRLEVHTDDRLRELDFGEAEGSSLDDVRATDARTAELFVRDPVAHHFPGGEHPERAADRATAAVREIAGRAPGRTALVICHNTIIRLVVCRFLNIPLHAYRTALRGVQPGATVQLAMRPDGTASLEHYNHTAAGNRPAAADERRRHVHRSGRRDVGDQGGGLRP